MHIQLLILAFIAAASAQPNGPDLTVCDPSKVPKSTKPLPPLPKKFSTRVECNFVDKNTTIVIDEYYDFDGNRGAIHDYRYNMELIAIYDYSTNEMISVIPAENNVCNVADLSTSAQNFIFGYNHTGQGTKAHIFSVNGALRFGGKNKEQYQGKATIRGIAADRWTSCIYMPDMKATLKVTYFFSDPDNWATETGQGSFPLRVHIYGNVYDDGSTKPRKISHSYQFINFASADDYPFGDEVFEVPAGTVCPGRKNTKALPTPPQAFSFTSEVIQPLENFVQYVKEYYDYKARLVGFQYTPLGNGEFGSNPMSEVHDFSTGIRYVTDRVRGNCTPVPLQAGTFDTKKLGPAEVRIRTAKEFFDFDNVNGNGYTYEGVRTVRGIPADVWIGVKQGFPYGCTDNCSASFEWYYEQEGWAQASGRVIEEKEPIRLEIRSLTYDDVHYIYNIINFDEEEPVFSNYDISACYEYIGRKHVLFGFPGNYLKYIWRSGFWNFRKALLKQLQLIMGISPLRINNIRFSRANNNNASAIPDLLVDFYILDRAPIVGSIANRPVERSMDAALNLFGESVYQNQFFVPLNGVAGASKIFAVPDSVQLVSRSGTNYTTLTYKFSNTGYSTGALVGAGIGMALFGAVLTALLLWGIMKYKGFRLHGFMPRKFTDSQME